MWKSFEQEVSHQIQLHKCWGSFKLRKKVIESENDPLHHSKLFVTTIKRVYHGNAHVTAGNN